MKRVLSIAILLAVALTAKSWAQGGGYTLVTGTLAIYANGSVQAAYINQSTVVALPLLNGSVFPQTAATNFDSSGVFSFYLADNNIISPGPSQWKITVCAKGGGQPPCYSVQLTITGTSQDISSAIAPAPPTPTSGCPISTGCTFLGPVGAPQFSAGTGGYKYGPIPNQYVVTEGDSITAGFGLSSPSTQSWPAQLMQLPFFKTSGTLVNAAVSGSTCASMTSRYTSAVLPFKPNGTTIVKSYLMILIGRNNFILGAPITDLEACIDAYVTQANTDGFTTVLMTILPATIIQTPYSGFVGTWDSVLPWMEAKRQVANDYIRRDLLPAFVFDMGVLLPNPYDVNWTQDGTHPTAIADAYFARAVNEYFQSNATLFQSGKPPDGNYFDALQGGNPHGGYLVGGGNLGATATYVTPGVTVGWNVSGGLAEGDLLCAPTTGTCPGYNFYTLSADGTTPVPVGTLRNDGTGTIAQTNQAQVWNSVDHGLQSFYAFGVGGNGTPVHQFEQVRVTMCSTVSGLGNLCDTTFSWPNPFAATSYTVNCTLDATGSNATATLTLFNKSTTGGSLRLVNVAAGFVNTGIANCTAWLD